MADMCFDITGRPQELLNSITSKERTDLIRFAYYRLKHFSMPVDWDQDLYQEATAAVVRGLEGIEGEGRKPNAWALKDKENFNKYLKGAIRSIAEGWARTWRKTHQKQHDSADLMYEVLMSPHRGQVEYLDLVSKLFNRLHQIAPARLLPTIVAWEQALDGNIPTVTSRKHTAAVKQLAQKILVEMGIVPNSIKPPVWVSSGTKTAITAQDVMAGVNEPFDT